MEELFSDDDRVAMDIDVYWEGTELRLKATGLRQTPDFGNSM